MIKFFRKIRQNMIKENRVSKYMLYAIGEIILVVIGILIAIQINNKNEENKIEDEMNGIYQSIVDELEADIQTLDKILPDYA